MEWGKDYLLRQLVKLGDMMGDGLHHEPDGKWIAKEYRQICMALYPERFAEINKKRSDRNKEKILNFLAGNKCECGGNLLQKRKGSKRCYCDACNANYTMKIK